MSNKPIVEYEAGQTPYPFEEMTTSDNTTFAASIAPWSDAVGAEPVISPYGLLTGGAITPNTGTDDSVLVAALTAMMPEATGANSSTGVVSVSGSAVAVSRGSADAYRITSITVDATGSLAAENGLEGTAFTETRGAAGGPPLIAVGSIEIGQVRLSSLVAADVAASEIYQIAGSSLERSDYPVYSSHYGAGTITFATALPAIHTGNVSKKVFVRASVPMFAPLSFVADWVPAETTYSVTSEDTYDGPIGSESSSLGQASFTALGLTDGITDTIVLQKGKRLWYKFRPDRNRLAPYQLTQGTLGISRTFPASGGSFSASCTITPRTETLDITS